MGSATAKESGHLAVNGDEHRRLTVPAHSLGLSGKTVGVYTDLVKEATVAQPDRSPVDLAGYAFSRKRFEGFYRLQGRTFPDGPTNDGSPKGVFAALFEARRQGGEYPFPRTPGPATPDQHRLP